MRIYLVSVVDCYVQDTCPFKDCNNVGLTMVVGGKQLNLNNPYVSIPFLVCDVHLQEYLSTGLYHQVAELKNNAWPKFGYFREQNSD